MRVFLQDLRFGFRLWKRDPGFTVVGVLTLALGIAVNTTVFSWIDSILLRPFPGAENASELAIVETVTPGAPNGGTSLSYPDARDYARNLKSIAGLAVYREEVFSLGDASDTFVRWGQMVSGNYFDVLQMKPAKGRLFNNDEHGVAVISHRLWRRNPSVLGRTVEVNRRNLTIVGVTPPEFRGTMPGLALDIWVPLNTAVDLGILAEQRLQSRDFRHFYGLARLKPGVGIPAARAEIATFARHLETSLPKSNTGVSATVIPPYELHSGAPEILLKPLRILMAIAIILMLIVCANIANLLLARAVARRKEIAVRLALGAGGFRLARQLFTETLMLAAVGALLGVALTPWFSDLLPALIPDVNAPIALGYEWNARVLLFMVLITVGAAFVAGMVPAITALHADLNDSLKEGGRSGNQGVQSHRARNLLVTSEVTLACLALISAGIFLRSFQQASNIHPGFERSEMVLARYYLSGTGFSNAEMQQFSLRLRERLRATPSVEDVTYADYAPLGTSAGPYNRIEVVGYLPGEKESMNVNRYLVSPGYFRTLRIPLLEGRDFRESDNGESTPVIIVNQAFAKRYFQGGPVIGREVRLGGKPATVVGLAKDSKYFNVAEAPRPHFYAPFRQRARGDVASGGIQQLYVFVRTAASPQALGGVLREELSSVDIMRLAAWTDVTLIPQKMMASMAAALGLISLLLAAVGLYSVMAHSVAQRTREIGIRMALGAQTRDVLRRVMLQGLGLVLPGVVFGILAALASLRIVSAMLVNVGANDPVSYGVATLFLVFVALLATYFPARRATKVDPMTTLRCD